ncbi:MAG: hypothetical protein QW524_02535 [Candidatus Woesearchaeota archaeon]
MTRVELENLISLYSGSLGYNVSERYQRYLDEKRGYSEKYLGENYPRYEAKKSYKEKKGFFSRMYEGIKDFFGGIYRKIKSYSEERAERKREKYFNEKTYTKSAKEDLQRDLEKKYVDLARKARDYYKKLGTLAKIYQAMIYAQVDKYKQNVNNYKQQINKAKNSKK